MNTTKTLTMPSSNILLIGGNVDEARMLKTALAFYGQGQKSMHTVIGGTDALAFLRCEGRYANEQRPGLIVLNLELLPDMSARQVLSAIKRDQQLDNIPLVVLGDSGADRLSSHRHLGNPMSAAKLMGAASAIHNLWLDTEVPVQDMADVVDGLETSWAG